MFAHRLDAERGLIVWYFGGKTNTDADGQGYVDTFARADALGATPGLRKMLDECRDEVAAGLRRVG